MTQLPNQTEIFRQLLQQIGLETSDPEQIKELSENFYKNLDTAVNLRLLQLFGDISQEELDALTSDDITNKLAEQDITLEQIMILEANQLAAELKSAVDYAKGYMSGLQKQDSHKTPEETGE